MKNTTIKKAGSIFCISLDSMIIAPIMVGIAIRNENLKASFSFTPAIFAPAKLVVNNISTGKIHTIGKVNNEMLEKSVNFQV